MWAVACLFLVLPLTAQSVRVYSEFVEFDRAAMVSAPPHPREILSPAVPRNGFTSLQISVQVPPEKSYFLYIRQNPEDALRIVPFREESDQLRPMVLPFHGSGPQVFWMDVWAERTAPLKRIVVEPQVRIGDDWLVYPMEARIINTIFPDTPLAEGLATPYAVLKAHVCGGKIEAAPPGPRSLARLRFRNAQQDLLLAAGLSKDALSELMGGCNSPEPQDPESYLRIRDYLLRTH